MSEPTIRELLDMIPQTQWANKPVDLLTARVETVLKLHSPWWTPHDKLCATCETGWPCETMRALNGEKPSSNE